jgi:3-methyladenine DNA glycosylase AlkD
MRLPQLMEDRNRIQKLIGEIRESLNQLSDPKRIEFAATSYPTKMEVLGVTVPNLKLVLKELKEQTRDFAEADKLKLVHELVHEDVFEMQQLAFDFLQTDKKLQKYLTPNFIESIELNLDNWLSVDYFGATIVGVAWRENLISTEKVKDYLSSDDFWKRRVAVVSTIALNQKARGGKGDPQRTLEICALVVDDHEDMMVKALSWALRELAKRGTKPVAEFIQKYEDRLHKKVIREVRNKLAQMGK